MRTISTAFLLLLLLLTPVAQIARGQTDTPPPTVEEIKAKLTELGDDPNAETPPATTDDTVRAYRVALEAAKTAAASRQLAAEFRAKSEAAPALIKQFNEELSKDIVYPTIAAPPDATLADLERLLAGAEAELVAARTEFSNIRDEKPRRDTRRSAIPGEIAAAQADVDRIQQEFAAPAPAEFGSERLAARKARLRAQLEAAEAKIAELQAESVSYDTRVDLLKAKDGKASRRVTVAEYAVGEWQKIVNARRQRDAQEAAQQASERDLAQAEKVPALATIAAQNRELVKDLQGPNSAPKQLANATQRLTDIRSRLDDRKATASDIRIDAQKPASPAFGLRLQSTLRDLNDARVVSRQLAITQETEINVSLRLEEVEEIDKQFNDAGAALAKLLNELGPNAEQHEALARRLLDQQRTLASQAVDTLDTLAETLSQLDTVYREYLDVTETLRAFIKDRVFWVRSVPRDRLVPHAGDYAYDIAWLTNKNSWRTALLNSSRQLVSVINSSADPGSSRWHYLIMPVGSALLITFAWLARWRLIVRSRAPLPTHGRFQSMTMGGAFLKLGLTIAAALPLPLALWVVAMWIGSTSEAFSASPDDPTPAPLALASGLSRAAFVLFGLSLLRGLTRRSGVGVSQFRWSETGLAHLRFHLRWLTPIGVIVACIVQTYDIRADKLHPEAVGRTALFVALIAVTVFHWFVFSPRRPFIAEYIKKHRRGLLERASWLWFPLLVVVPALLAIGTAAGYVYTALQIQRSIGNTYLFVLVMLVAQGLVMRSLQLARRKIAIEAAKARAAAAAAAAAAAQEAEGTASTTPKEPEPVPEVDLTAISLQSRKVIQVFTIVVLTLGLYAVWNDVLPALKWFERLQVLPEIRYIDLDTTDADTATSSVSAGSTASSSQTTAQPTNPNAPLLPTPSSTAEEDTETVAPLPARVTVADIGLALLLIVLTVSASRNVPGLLEITLLPRLPLDAATRYAIFSIVRYLLIIIGVIAISKALSIPWRSAQWLAAALTFGLAFGMQEIFANFVAGIIMLFEQPVRVGDTVTIGSVSGTVTRIRMRATTITDWDNKELIIPNKTFITDQVINWTLSDPTMRVVISVGIAYGSNTELARELLLKVAGESEYTIDTPAPRALFLGFGDNSLNFSLRVYIDSIDNLVASTSDLHFRIDRAFRDADIEISFPQRDLHIRSLDPSILEQLNRPAFRNEPPRTTEDGAS